MENTIEFIKKISGIDLSGVLTPGDGNFVMNYTHVAGYTRMILFTNTIFFIPHTIKDNQIIKFPLQQTDIKLKQNSFLKAIFSGKNSLVITDGAQSYDFGVGQEVTYNGVKMHYNNPKCNEVFVKHIQNMKRVLLANIFDFVQHYSIIKSLNLKSDKPAHNKFSWMGPQEVIFVLPEKVIIVNEDISELEKAKVNSVELLDWKKPLGTEKYIKIVAGARTYAFVDYNGNKDTVKTYNSIIEALQ